MGVTEIIQPIKRFLSPAYWWLRRWLPDVRLWFGDLVKAVVMLVFLKPAAMYLPAGWSYSLARAFAAINALSPCYGRETFHLIRKTHARDRREARRLARSCLARHFLDFVSMRRILSGREQPESWPVVERNRDDIEKLRRSNASYIVATGHFNRYAHSRFFLPRTIPQQTLLVANPPFPKSLHPRILWSRAHYGQMLEVVRFLRPDAKFLQPGRIGLVKDIVRSLQGQGNALLIYADAPWTSKRTGGFARPFAGKKNKGFATGAARIARLAQCPIILCLPYQDADGKVILEWGRMIEPPAPQDEEADLVNTNLLLNDIEQAVGMRPDQYVMDFLGERKWNFNTQEWE